VTAAISVSELTKRFRLVHERNSTFKATVFRGMRRTTYEEFWALKGVTFDVPVGSTFGLIGENGSGKSTLLKCLARIYQPTGGSIATRGKLSALLELGAGFHPELSGRENVYLNGSILGLSQREISLRFDEIVEFSGLEHFIDSPVKNYSSGMFVRLGFAVAINVEPDILLVDEVLAVGDEDFQRRCAEKFAELRQSGRTIVLVSHGLDTVRNICDHCAWLDHGELRAVGPAAPVVEAYLDKVRTARRDRDAEHTSTGGSTALTVELHDERGEASTLVRANAPVTLHVNASHRGADLGWAVVVDVQRSDGVHLARTWHRVPAGAPADQHLQLEVPNLPLMPGTYDLLVQTTGSDLVPLVDVPVRIRIDVVGNEAADRGGLIDLGGRWSTA
jgi:ABC-type polysaccharide/polyol phosphate transport system ATPase subunit